MHRIVTLMAALLLVSAGLPLIAQSHVDVVGSVSRDSDTQTLVSLVKRAGLVEALSAPNGPYTLLAPTDKAFAKLPKSTVKALLKPENRDQLQRILKYHVVPGSLRLDALVGRGAVATLAGDAVRIAADGDGRVKINGASRFGAINTRVSNGFVHEIDTVLMPPAKNIVEVAADAGSFGTLIAAAKAAGLAGALSGPGPFTVLAPTDEAFGQLGKKKIAELLRPENKPILAAILKYHVIPGRILAADAVRAGAASPLLKRGRLDFGIREGQLRVKNASVVTNDIIASNGVIHVINRVLMPPSSLLPKPQPVGRKYFGVYLDTPSEALSRQLRLNRHGSSVVTRLTRGGPAVGAGLKAYDVILKIDGGAGTLANLKAVKRRRSIGDEVEFVVLRQGKRRSLTIPIGADRH